MSLVDKWGGGDGGEGEEGGGEGGLTNERPGTDHVNSAENIGAILGKFKQIKGANWEKKTGWLKILFLRKLEFCMQDIFSTQIIIHLMSMSCSWSLIFISRN